MSSDSKDPAASTMEQERLEWLQTVEHINEIQIQENRSGGMREKMTAKIRQNPFVPIGMLATVIALSAGLYAMGTGNKRNSQLMMRARIGAQGFTVAALLIGIVVAAKTTKV